MTDLVSHGVPDDVDPDDWRLRLSGAVADALALTRADLASFPLEAFRGDFACEEGWVAEDLTWRGVRVGTLLDRAGVTDDGEYALVRAMDGDYACSFPLDRLAESVLALELDGDPLDVEHGGPVRLVPTHDDRDCWESIKWVSAIEVTTSKPTGDTAREIALGRIN
ncbi:MAG: molybdopterin-dependent oxidoreductase [Haloarculaceae archaeon]